MHTTPSHVALDTTGTLNARGYPFSDTYVSRISRVNSLYVQSK